MRVCDKCNGPLPPDYMQMQYPIFYIQKIAKEGFFKTPEQIDLCPSCCKKLDKWLKNESYHCTYNKECTYNVKEI